MGWMNGMEGVQVKKNIYSCTVTFLPSSVSASSMIGVFFRRKQLSLILFPLLLSPCAGTTSGIFSHP